MLFAQRVPSMHGWGEDHLIFELEVDGDPLGSTMGGAWCAGPDALLVEGFSLPDTHDAMGHGAPGSIPQLRLQMASSGGDACT